MEYEKINGKVTVTIGNIKKPIAQWAREYNISEKTLAGRIYSGWNEEHLFDPPGLWKPEAKFNEHYFDNIDDEHKAYWIGFIWCDGYMAIRNRKEKNTTSYEFKLSLKKDDYGHLEKFNNDLNGKYKVHFYNSKGFDRSETAIEARLLITNLHFGKILVEQYRLIPGRSDCSKLLSHIPEHLMKHFIRGIIDADGSFCHYVAEETNKHGLYIVQKCVVDIGGQPELLKAIEQHLIQNHIVNNFDRKIHKRHEDDQRDGAYRNLKFCGRNQAMKLLHYIYDNATIYLDRKYEKFLSIVAKLEED